MQEPPVARRGRGRPREIARREPGTGTPLGGTLDDYQPTTRAILVAARAIVLRLGVPALTLRRAAEEAHVDVTTVTYHFGTRGGLLEALVDSLYAEQLVVFMEEAGRCATPAERAEALFRAVRRECAGREDGVVYAAIVAEGLRDERLRARLAKLNEWTIRAFAEAVYGDAAQPLLEEPKALAAMQLMAAAVDGIEVHGLLDPDGFALDEVLDLLQRLLPLPGGEPEPSGRAVTEQRDDPGWTGPPS